MNKMLDMKLPEDFSQIDTNNLGEFKWWSAHLGVGCEKLLSVINKAGHSSEEVSRYLYANKNVIHQ